VTTHVVRHIGELTTNDPSVGDGSVMGRLVDAALVMDDERILWVGPDRQAPAADESIDVAGAAVIPGFVDSHTHLIFAGERSDEFEARLRGERYDGGGIMRTVRATREASDEHLVYLARERFNELRMSGVTTLEIKSGYDLTSDGELRLLRIARAFSDEVTLLGAHVVPSEYVSERAAYVDLICSEMIPAARGLARWVDVFCDTGAFDVDETRTIATRALEEGFGLRLHGNQLGETGGVALAVELGAASVDHCTFVSDHDLDGLADRNVVATLLPGAEFSTRSPYPNARRFLDAGVTVALATDCNPGTSYVTSMPLVIALAVREMAMSVDEALWSATRGGALALRRPDVGHLGVGARADVVVLNAPRAAHLAYRPGGRLVDQVL
jgi:imidazolonepropionase